MGLFCKEAEEDAKGVQVIHGAANMFYEGKSFRQIFLAYEKVPRGFNFLVTMI